MSVTARPGIRSLLAATIILAACGGSGTSPDPTPVTPAPPQPPPGSEATSRVVVDAAAPLGPVMRLERASTHSTSSPFPGEPTRVYMQGLQHDVVRTWIQARFVYNNGNINYNYRYDLSGVGAEDALRFYATTAKKVLIAFSAYTASAGQSLPQGEAFKDFLRETLIYYKRKYPNLTYVQVGNEPDADDTPMSTYYPIYRAYYRAVNEANASLQLTGTDRLLISNGPFTSNVTNMLVYANTFFAAYAADPDPAKKLDFFSFHVYGETDRPVQLGTARSRIDAAMASHVIPKVPVFVTEYGVFGGSTLPTGFTRTDLITIQPAGQLTKGFYLYEGGIDAVFNWTIHHGTLAMKSQLADVASAVAYPYGNALRLARMVSDRETRIGATSKSIDANGLGTHVLASMKTGQGIAVLVWNYNWRTTPSEAPFDVFVKNIPQTAVGGGKVRRTIFIIDSKTNNFETNPAQNSLQPSSTALVDYAAAFTIPLTLERQSVALILLTPGS